MGLIKVLIKGTQNTIDFPDDTAIDVIENSIKGNWENVEKLSGLPMDTASRMDRARHLGFDPDDVSYRGLSQPYDESKVDHLIWTTDNPEYASAYAYGGADKSNINQGGNVLPLNVKAENPFDFGFRSQFTEVKYSDMLDRLESGVTQAFKDKRIGREEGLDILDEIIDLRESAPDINEFKPVFNWWNDKPEMVEILKKAKFDGLSAKEGINDDINTLAVFSPDQTKSIHAAFDPTKQKKGDLLGGLTAGAVGVGALTASQESEASFLGQAAKGAAKDMLGMAQKMDFSGVDPAEIWKKTGWGKGVDDKWRFEVSDQGMYLDPDAISMSEHGFNTAKGSELVKGSGVGEAYPDILEDTTVSFNPKLDAQGSLSTLPGSKILGTKDFHSLSVRDAASKVKNQAKIDHRKSVLADLIGNKEREVQEYIADGSSKKEALEQYAEDLDYWKESIRSAHDEGNIVFDPKTRSTISHEMQHIVQDKEKFARGGSAGEFGEGVEPGEINALRVLMNKEAAEAGKKPGDISGVNASKKFKSMFGREPTISERILSNDIQDEMNSTGLDVFSTKTFKEATLTPYERYKRLAGEVEARNVQTRLGMSDADRRKITPIETEDVPRSEQVVRYGAGAAGVGGLSQANKAEAATGEQDDDGFFAYMADMFTGESRTTPEMERLQEIGYAPEINEFTMSAFKTSLGLLTTGDTKKLKTLITNNIPSAKFREDSKGNTIVDLPSGSFALDKPGFSPQDMARTAFDIASFIGAGRVASGAATTLRGAELGAGVAGATRLGIDVAGQAAGTSDEISLANVDPLDVTIETVLGGMARPAEIFMKAIPKRVKRTRGGK